LNNLNLITKKDYEDLQLKYNNLNSENTNFKIKLDGNDDNFKANEQLVKNLNNNLDDYRKKIDKLTIVEIKLNETINKFKEDID